jgi:hypothetical protein
MCSAGREQLLLLTGPGFLSNAGVQCFFKNTRSHIYFQSISQSISIRKTVYRETLFLTNVIVFFSRTRKSAYYSSCVLEPSRQHLSTCCGSNVWVPGGFWLQEMLYLSLCNSAEPCKALGTTTTYLMSKAGFLAS